MSTPVSSFVQGAPDSTGKKVDVAVTSADSTVLRQRIGVSDSADDVHARVKNTHASPSEEGLLVRLIGEAYLAGIRDSVKISHDPEDGPLWVTQAEGFPWRSLSQSRIQNSGNFVDAAADAQGRTLAVLQEGLTPTTGRLVQATGFVTAPLYGGNSATIFVGDPANTAYAGLNFRADLSFDGGLTWMLSAPMTAVGAVTTVLGLAATGVIANTAGGRAYAVTTYGATHIRVQATAYTSGTGYVLVQPTFAPIPSSSTTTTVANASIAVTGSLTSAGTTTATTTGATPTASAVNSAATTNATSIKASAGTVYNIVCTNTGAGAAFVKFYNLAVAPTVGTSTPLFTLAVPASGSVIFDSVMGQRFGTGIALAITNLAADSDTTAVAAAQVKVATSYI